MPTCLWTFDTLTTTGMEGDADVNNGIVIQSQGDGPPVTLAVPCPSVPGETGNGRIMASFGKFNRFATAREAALAYTAGQPISLSYQWRPLVEFNTASVFSMGGFTILGRDGFGFGNMGIEVSFNATTTPGLYDLNVTTHPAINGSVGNFSMSIRDWHEIEMSYDGAGTVSFYVDGGLVGTRAYTPVSTADISLGIVANYPPGGAQRALLAVLDTVEFTIS